MKNKIIIILFLLTAFCAAPVFAQEKSKDKIISEYTKLKEKLFVSQEKQCEIYDKEDISGKPISLNVVNKDIRDVLKEIAKQNGVEFEVDKSVGQILITANASGSWNLWLNSLLESNGLEAQKQCPIIRIVKSENPIVKTQIREVGFDTSSLYTEFIILKNLRLNDETTNSCSTNQGEASKFITILAKLLSRRGAIEIDTRTNLLIITDYKNRTELISNFVRLLDDSGFTTEELVNESAFEIK